ncbi:MULTISPECIES: LysR family transcriptional regulator [unclassified Roseateles]|uniref:LysR family transcriptional regulator n=1 Tax=unclassified Roseateles TaxID=2626991 RepID=UPI0022492343|nr:MULTISPECIES: LysR family transcriptional regulator [unclassified Roseateles]MCX2862928.1 LysR family transcriptional regulator [Paucibacter sp. PLA-PC-4]MDC6167268.1 LysR family transcriptional regulator [Paucibacter sp. XJ19-41]
MAINFDLNDLLAFRAVAELGNFRRAAEAVHISQPAFSRRIDKLEQALGVKLLDRTTRRVSLTAVGRDFARKVQQLLDELDNTLLGIRGVSATRMGEVSIACVPSTVYYYLSRVIGRYRERYPKIRLKVFDAGAGAVLDAVARGEVDFGLNFIGSQEPDIEFHALLEERFVAACRRDHPLARKRQVAWHELAAYDYIAVAKNSGNRLLLDQALAGVAGLPEAVYETQHVTTTLGLVEAGLGVAAVPSLAMPDKSHPLLVSVPLVEPAVSRHVGLIRRKGRSLSPAAQQLYDFFVEMKLKPAARKKAG